MVARAAFMESIKQTREPLLSSAAVGQMCLLNPETQENSVAPHCTVIPSITFQAVGLGWIFPVGLGVFVVCFVYFHPPRFQLSHGVSPRILYQNFVGLLNECNIIPHNSIIIIVF